MVAYAWFLFALSCYGLAMTIGKEGQRKDELFTVHNFWISLANLLIILPILGRAIGIW